MNSRFDYMKYIKSMRLKKLGNEQEAGLWITSLPVPENFSAEIALSGKDTYIGGIGQWPGEDEYCPRRLLLIADGNNTVPESIRLSAATSAQSNHTPGIQMELVEKCGDPGFMWERHMARIEWESKSVGLLMGLRKGAEIHWWEACNMVVLEDTPACRVVEIGGTIPVDIYDSEDLKKYKGYANPYLHKHQWLNGQIYARLHANGVCEVFAHHINSKFFDDGLDLKNIVPVIGIKVLNREDSIKDICGSWDGSQDTVTIGGVAFDMSHARHLATPEHPGQFMLDNGVLVWQPYEGVELYGGISPMDKYGDGYIFRVSDNIFPRGMARTVRFSFSLSRRSPKIARYVAPAWWYGLCGEFLPEPLLPVSNEYDKLIDASRNWIKESVHRGGFEDGSVPRNNGKIEGSRRYEPGWEGEMPGAQFLCAWRTGDAEDYDLAMRSAYVFTDVYVDHAAKAVRMHGYPPHAFSVPMARVHGPIAAYLETGDPYLIRTARSVTETAYWTHKNSWPRMCVGRDACFIRGAVMLYRYFNDRHFKDLAKDGIKDVIASQRQDGSFGDQAGGTGIHQLGAYITKPWMGLMALGGVVDYLELFPDETDMLAAVKRYGDWLMRERFSHNGTMGWSYQHNFNGGIAFRDAYSWEWTKLKQPGDSLWHLEYMARFMGYCSIRFNDPSYFDAWSESYSAVYGENPSVMGDHAVTQVFQYIPWLQAKLWNATAAGDEIKINPLNYGARTPKEGKIMTPDGEIDLKWDEHRSDFIRNSGN